MIHTLYRTKKTFEHVCAICTHMYRYIFYHQNHPKERKGTKCVSPPPIRVICVPISSFNEINVLEEVKKEEF